MHNHHSECSSQQACGELKDPVCGMSVTPESENRHEHGGHTYYFCSGRCAGKFAADPIRYLAPPKDAGEDVDPSSWYTCPMHPEVRQRGPGTCPKCGMALEAEAPSLDEEENPELVDFTRRFWISLPLSLAVFVLAMFGHGWLPEGWHNRVELALATPVVLWCGLPFFTRGVQSVFNRSPNMWTLIGLGTASARASRGKSAGGWQGGTGE